MKLKACPFCGTDNAYLNSKYSYKVKKYFVWAECDICGARSKATTDDEAPSAADWTDTACIKVAASWNTRAGVVNA